MMLADELADIAPDWLRNAILFIAGVAASAYYVKEIFWSKKRGSVEIEKQPVRVEQAFPPATTGDLDSKSELHNIRFTEHGRRLDGHDKEITNLWNTMRTEDKEIRHSISEKFERVSKALGRIEQALEDWNKPK